jgi:hypothetical protein
MPPTGVTHTSGDTVNPGVDEAVVSSAATSTAAGETDGSSVRD